jgi:hypothetical protein
MRFARGSPPSEAGKRAAALAVATLALLVYRATMLPGVDLGDTASFQAAGGSPAITPRDGYPLYFAIGSVFVHLAGDHAYGMNLASAVAAAIACGLVVLVAGELSGSLAAGVGAALLLGTSYTFWSQAVIAEVYALHICLIALTLLLLLRWSNRPTAGRLALFFAAYAAGFGNHLTLILLAPAYAVFLLATAPGGWRSVLAPRTIAMAAVFAAAGALQYAWNLRGLWLQVVSPPSLGAALQTFWFDATKADWRASMILGVPEAAYAERLRMYAFDVRQQFGWVGPVLALCGAWQLLRTATARGVLLLLVFAANATFALAYNVGDTHVFLLPAHLALALLAAPGLAAIEKHLPRGRVVALVAILLVVARGYRDYPALDRSDDHRPGELLATLTDGIDHRRTILIADLNWQVQNGLAYYTTHVRRDVAWARLADIMLYAPALVRDNLAIARDVIVTARARDRLSAAYGPLFEFRDTAPDRSRPPAMAALVRQIAPGTRYILSVLKPTRELAVDEDDLRATVRFLTGGRVDTLGSGDYAAIGGLIGSAPALHVTGMHPFTRTATLDGVGVTVRMDSWLPFDTFRRMGFGHVIAAGRHTMILERGVNLVAFGGDGRPRQRAYAAGIYAREPLYVIDRLALR